MICPKCGKDAGESKFCPHCGTDLSQPGTAAEMPAPGIPQNINVTISKKKKPIFKRFWFWILVVVVIFLIIPKGSKNASSSSESPSEVSENASDSSKKKSEISYEITDTVNVIEDSEFDSGKTFSTIIEITNTGDIPIYLDDCVLDFEDDEGHLLQTYDFLSKTPDIVQPGEKGYFYTNGSPSFDEDVDFSKGCNLVPDVSIEKATGTLKRHDVIDTTIYSSDNTVGCKGRIVNETDEDISLIYVTTIYYDSAGKVLGISGTNVTDLKANKNTSFDISGIFMNDFSVDDVAEYVVYADEMYLQF